ncbi:MAG: four helix bundle protein [Bacteroidetes bacterium]|nr:four helix bundle protein [Bacteroidota bacterium]
MAFSFEKLKIWQKALALSKDIHELTLTFPKEELYILSSQIKRAADSVGLNIAEGAIGQSKKEFSRFLSIAQRSGIEVVACLHLAKARNIINEIQFQKLYTEIEELVKMIQGLKNSLSEKTMNRELKTVN